MSKHIDDLMQEVFIRNSGSNAGQAHNRFVKIAGSTIAADIGNASWEADEKVSAFRVKVTNGTAGNRVRFVLDATPVDDLTDTSQAQAWLAAVLPVASADLDVEYFEVAQGGANGVNEWSEWYELGGYLRRLDAIAVDADVETHIFIEVA